MKNKTVMFNQVLDLAVAKAKAAAAGIGNELTLIRDLRGRIRVLLPGNRDAYQGENKTQLESFTKSLSESLGNYCFPPERTVLFTGELVQGEQAVTSSDRRLISDVEGRMIWLLDRQITGQDWLRGPFSRATTNSRVTFFGIKGGVGRSTAAVIWAWRLAKQGKKVLIFDLDLESPGISSTLLPSDHLPDFGIVDWLVEDGVGQAEAVKGEMIASSPLAQKLAGEIRIVSAFGGRTVEYLPKLARCYAADSVGIETSSWGDRLERLVAQMEAVEKPDIVILDSRAGIHDIAAVAVTRMDAQSFLFAVDSPQTWKAYSFLFHHWRQHPKLGDLRERLKIVASMVPETGREEYLKRFREHSWDVFREYLYEEAAPDSLEAFSFDLNDEDAPHYPLPIFWHRALQEFNPTASETGLDETTAAEALGKFMDAADPFATTAGEGEYHEN